MATSIRLYNLVIISRGFLGAFVHLPDSNIDDRQSVIRENLVCLIIKFIVLRKGRVKSIN